MNNENPWLEAAKAMSDLIKQEPPEVQQAMRELSRKVYPETWQAKREKEQENAHPRELC